MVVLRGLGKKEWSSPCCGVLLITDLILHHVLGMEDD